MLSKCMPAAAAVLALSLLWDAGAPTFAQGSPGAPVLAPEVYFDLGIDVTRLPRDPVAARRYFASLLPETQQILMASCRNYLAHPLDANMPETLVFCKAIVDGLG